jgi:hypothetical protein
MDGRSTMPPMGIIKNEDEPSIRNNSLTTKTNAALPQPYLSRKARSILPPSNPPNSHRVISPEIEIPPRFQPILERMIRQHPELVEKRYNEFLTAETMGSNAPLQEADKIKL